MLVGLLFGTLVLVTLALVLTSRQLHRRDRLWRAREAGYRGRIATLEQELTLARLSCPPALMPTDLDSARPVPLAQPDATGPTRRRATATIRLP